MDFIALRGTVRRSKPSKSWRIHLLLKQVAIVGVVNIRVCGRALRVGPQCVGGSLSRLRAHPPQQLTFIFDFWSSLSTSIATSRSHLRLPLIIFITILSKNNLWEFIDLLTMHACASKLSFYSSTISRSSLAWPKLAVLAHLVSLLFPCHSSAAGGSFLISSTSSPLWRIVSLYLLYTSITRVPVSLIAAYCCSWHATGIGHCSVCSCFPNLTWSSFISFLRRCSLFVDARCDHLLRSDHLILLRSWI